MGIFENIDFDREAQRSLMSAVFAGVTGSFFGCGRRAAILAACSSAAAAALRPQLEKNQSFNKGSKNGKRLIESIIAVPLTAIIAHQLGYRVFQEELIIVFAGTFAGGHSEVDDKKISGIILNSAIGFGIGTLYPQWFSPLEGALLMAAVAAQDLAAEKAYNDQSSNSAHIHDFLKTAYLCSLPWIAQKLNFRFGATEVAGAALIHLFIPVIKDAVN